jgi:3-hydroxyisobutyrate dehydrogenase-like beta-hydroxyacid dehydrogenase
MVLEGRGYSVRGVTQMKLVVTILVAAFMVAAGMSFAFAECAGHNKAQLVQMQSTDPQLNADQQANNGTRAVAPDKVAQKVTDAKDPVKK